VNNLRPDGWHTVTPRIITRDIDGLIEFMRSVFAARGEPRVGRPVEMKIGDSVILVSDGGGMRENWPAFLYVYVEAADATYERALQVGAISVEEPMDTPYGDRRATIRDQWGNMWQIAERFS
jgi:PhnB protein